MTTAYEAVCAVIARALESGTVAEPDVKSLVLRFGFQAVKDSIRRFGDLARAETARAILRAKAGRA